MLTRPFGLLLLILQSFASFGQSAVTGRIRDIRNQPVEQVAVRTGDNLALSDTNGFYRLELPPGNYRIIFRHVAFRPDTLVVDLGPNQEITLNPVLRDLGEVLGEVKVTDRATRQDNRIELDKRALEYQIGPTGGVENLVKTLPGVSSSNELSNQYSVRGGNFDENLVYVNGIEVYRPFLVRNGQQEGLSFIHSDLVERVEFSAGGFGARYGDKMSSVLDITYKRPDRFGVQGEASLLGGTLAVEGASKNKRINGLLGLRYRTNQLLLGSLDTDADFRPRFLDIQTMLTYVVNDRSEITFLGNLAKNIYEVTPRTRQTDFGTVQEALRLTVFFDGQENYEYLTRFGALSYKYRPNARLSLMADVSAFQTTEQEYFDVIGAYRLGELDNNLGSDDFGEIKFLRGVGEFQNYARNQLDAIIINAGHRGIYQGKKAVWNWGIKWQTEDILDKYKEWERIDSAGYSIPHHPSGTPPGTSPAEPDSLLELFEHFDSRVNIISHRFMGYVQRQAEWQTDAGIWSWNLGVRSQYWSFNERVTFSPRGSMSFKPAKGADQVFRFAAGYYHQPPLYREMRNLEGGVNHDIRAQEAIHFVLGHDWQLKIWGRNFRMVSEAYYKQLNNLIPYELDNVRLRYSAVNNARGFATGADFRINGEFVPGIDSWASLGVMTIQEDLEGDDAGYIPRPTDRRVNFALNFQDYLPGDPTFRMSITLFYATGLPFGAPQSERKDQIFRIPAYRRVDIGFLKVLKQEGKDAKWKPLNVFRSAWVGLEVFNLLQIRNTVSYLWVKDISTARQYAVPNYLTNRLLNVKLVFKI